MGRWSISPYRGESEQRDFTLVLLEGENIMGIYEELEWRGLIKDSSSPKIKDLLKKGMEFFRFLCYNDYN